MSKIKALRIIALAKRIACDTDEYREYAATHSEREANAFMWDITLALIQSLKNR